MYRMALAVAVLVWVAVPAFTAEDDHAKAKSVVEKAIQAAGWGKDTPTTARTWKDKGQFTGGGMAAEFTGDWAFAGPDKYRFNVVMKLGEQKFDLTVIVNGDRAQESAFGMTRPVEKEKLDYLRGQVYRLWVQSLVPLVADKEFHLKLLPETKVDGTAAVGVEVTRKGKPTVTLSFDAKTGLLLKSAMMAKNEFEGWKEVLSEGHIGGWKDVGGGRKEFTTLKVVTGGKTMMESVLSDHRAAAKLDAQLFELPAKK